MLIFYPKILSKSFNPLFISKSLFFIPKRFYPSIPINILFNTAFPKLTPSTSRRILRLIKKNAMLPEAEKLMPGEEMSYNALQTFSNIHKDRSSFFNAMRDTIQNNRLSLSQVYLSKSSAEEFHQMVSIAASVSRAMHYPIKKTTQEENNSKKPTQEKNNSKKPTQMSVEDKHKAFWIKHDEIIKEIKLFKENNTINDLKAKEIIFNKWHEYLENRGSLISAYTVEELKTNQFFETLFKSTNLAKEEFIAENPIKNKLNAFQKDITIDPNLVNTISLDCTTEEDYQNAINKKRTALNLLNSETPLNQNDILLLAIGGSSVTLDAYSRPSLSSETYEEMRNNPSLFNIKFTTDIPNKEEILSQIRLGNFYVRNASEDIPPGAVLSTGALLHKAIIIPTEKGLIYIGILTSTKKKTIQLSSIQESNLEESLYDKAQMYRSFMYFIKNTDDIIVIDLLAQGFLQGTNVDNEDVRQILLEYYSEQVLENTPIIEPSIVTVDILRNITKLFYEKQLKQLEDKLKALQIEINMLPTEGKRKEYRETLNTKRINKLEAREESRYSESLSSEDKILYKALKIFRKNKEKQEKSQKVTNKPQVSQEVPSSQENNQNILDKTITNV